MTKIYSHQYFDDIMKCWWSAVKLNNVTKSIQKYISIIHGLI